jgi:copper homeostasis protein
MPFLSGHGKTATTPSSLALLLELHRDSKRLSAENNLPPVTILPGSGINPDTIPTLLTALLPVGLREIHLSAGSWLESDMEYRRNDMGMGDWNVWQTDKATVLQIREAVDKAMMSLP